jgi:putative NIF3 family GTP cyclohydrolase 1 type 2
MGYDLVLTHHPTAGSPRLNLHQVMVRQIDRMVQNGVAINKAQKAIAERIEQVGRGLHVTNYDRVTSAARVLEMPFMGVHTPTDVLTEIKVAAHLEKAFADRPKATVGDVIESILEIPEFANALTKPKARVGLEKDYAGKIVVSMARGTGGGPDVAKAYFEAGVGTLVVMHMQEDVIKAVKEQNIGNVIVAGHMASDSVGINQLLDALEERGLEVTRIGGIVPGK